MKCHEKRVSTFEKHKYVTSFIHNVHKEINTVSIPTIVCKILDYFKLTSSLICITQGVIICRFAIKSLRKK